MIQIAEPQTPTWLLALGFLLFPVLVPYVILLAVYRSAIIVICWLLTMVGNQRRE